MSQQLVEAAGLLQRVQALPQLAFGKQCVVSVSHKRRKKGAVAWRRGQARGGRQAGRSEVANKTNERRRKSRGISTREEGEEDRALEGADPASLLRKTVLSLSPDLVQWMPSPIAVPAAWEPRWGSPRPESPAIAFGPTPRAARVVARGRSWWSAGEARWRSCSSSASWGSWWEAGPPGPGGPGGW